MRPINDDNFGVDGIKVSYYNGTSVVDGYIIQQIGASRFIVADDAGPPPTHVKTVSLAPTLTIANNLDTNPTYCTITTAGPGTGATFTAHYDVDLATLNAAGSGYSVGDVLTLASTSGATVTVTAVTGGPPGPVATYSGLTAGSGVTSLAITNVATTAAPSGGTGATFNLKYKLRSITSVGGSAYIAGEELVFTGMTAVTQPTASIATVSNGVPATFDITHGANITVAASSLTATPTEHVRRLWGNRLMTIEGNAYHWTLGTAVNGSVVIESFSSPP